MVVGGDSIGPGLAVAFGDTAPTNRRWRQAAPGGEGAFDQPRHTSQRLARNDRQPGGGENVGRHWAPLTQPLLGCIGKSARLVTHSGAAAFKASEYLSSTLFREA